MQPTVKQSVFPEDVSFFFEISRLESFCLRSEAIEYPVRRPYHQIVWITRGSGYFTIDLEKYGMSDNTIYTIPTGRFYQFSPTGDLAGYVLSFNTDFLHLAIGGSGRPFFNEIGSDLKQVNMFLLNAGNTSLERLLDDIANEFETHLTLRLEILSSYFRIFLIYMKRLATTIRQRGTISNGVRLFNSFAAALDNKFKSMKQVADYASELSVTPSYLTDVVKQVSGYSASYHIQQRLVQEAKRLAVYNNASLKMVAYTLGFDDLSHFSRFFKHAAGINFSEYKKTTCAREAD
jgi:AraC family transcriptional activator of pobA